MSDDLGHGSGAMQRGALLMEQRRYREAETYFREAIGQNPMNAGAFYCLANCQFQSKEGEKASLQTIEQAIALDPNGARHHALKAFILCTLNRPADALRSAEEAVGIDPDSTFCFTALAQAFLLLEKWPAAENAARVALSLDADSTAAANQLSHALRMQNRMAETADHIAGMLARDPENAFSHTSAGWAALQKGDRKQAESHFLEALRLSPEHPGAREGLIQSFRARSAFYRAYLSYSFAMQRMGKYNRVALIVGLYAASRFSRVLFTGQYVAVGWTIAAVYVVFALWTRLSPGVGNFILLFDRFARHALLRSEKAEGVSVGGGLILGLALTGIGLACKLPVLMGPGLTLAIAAIPFAMTFTNASQAGRLLFGAVGTFTLASGILLALGDLGLIGQHFSSSVFKAAITAAVLTTWIGNVPYLSRKR